MISRKTFIAKEWQAHLVGITTRVTLLNSFWGFDQAIPLLPNYIMTGPLMKDRENLLASLEEKDPKLFAWMNEAH
jgi:hypothetical protein